MDESLRLGDATPIVLFVAPPTPPGGQPVRHFKRGPGDGVGLDLLPTFLLAEVGVVRGLIYPSRSPPPPIASAGTASSAVPLQEDFVWEQLLALVISPSLLDRVMEVVVEEEVVEGVLPHEEEEEVENIIILHETRSVATQTSLM